MNEYVELLERLKQIRRGKVESAVASSFDVSAKSVGELAAIQAAIEAVQAVVKEAESFR